jgi:hypothetical protein
MNSSASLNLRRFQLVAKQRLHDRDNDDNSLNNDEAMVADTVANIQFLPAADEFTAQMQRSLLKQLNKHRARKMENRDRAVDDKEDPTSTTQPALVDENIPIASTSRPYKRVGGTVAQSVKAAKPPLAKRSNHSVFDDTTSAEKIHSLMLDQKVSLTAKYLY